ncbi:hypothetical protein [Streptomyces sp. NPDC093568]|uniref:hypothetical protein n=1 Tax=Streptomyces sp. NPDC093568 TaxID=3366041 RepID=UPI00382C4506
MLLTGIAFASLGVVDTVRHSSPEAGTSHSAPPSPMKSAVQDSHPVGTATASTTAPARPSTSKDTEAHWRAYDKARGGMLRRLGLGARLALVLPCFAALFVFVGAGVASSASAVNWAQ